jgi:hypothetical protein
MFAFSVFSPDVVFSLAKDYDPPPTLGWRVLFDNHLR